MYKIMEILKYSKLISETNLYSIPNISSLNFVVILLNTYFSRVYLIWNELKKS